MLRPWHDFYAITGEAAATLVGLMFVAASVGAGVYTQERQTGMRTLLSPTVVAFGVVMAVSLVAVLPARDGRLPALLLALVGGLGLAYSWRVWRRMAAGGVLAQLDAEDRIWYLLAPPLAYATLTAAAAAGLLAADVADTLLAAATGLLLLAGIRNAWDMTTWVILRGRG